MECSTKFHIMPLGRNKFINFQRFERLCLALKRLDSVPIPLKFYSLIISLFRPNLARALGRGGGGSEVCFALDHPVANSWGGIETSMYCRCSYVAFVCVGLCRGLQGSLLSQLLLDHLRNKSLCIPGRNYTLCMYVRERILRFKGHTRFGNVWRIEFHGMGYKGVNCVESNSSSKPGKQMYKSGYILCSHWVDLDKPMLGWWWGGWRQQPLAGEDGS